ncbi:Ku protein [Acetobacter sp. TBRC 12305]|uniref:Ku protein n=1 Tax=Acetobacter garciniae TaxID=2817435 RepID=A0A939HIP8_9PROT|nr:Ku protein [Acetobacter garciniae]MBO1325145.1 Ku protein [Acetobacter garciniae]MBX0344884.1 Ku protein [Acetobacter garciniae]
MAPKPFWSGHLKLSLVTCAVSMTPATTQNARIGFHTINRKTGHRVVSSYIDAQTHAAVADDALIKGYERANGQPVMLEDAELEAVALESTHVIEIEKFVASNDIGWIWYDTPHYLMPDDAIGAEAFAVIREAMHRTGTVGIARLVLYRREHAVLLKPRENGIVVWTLRYGEDIRPPRNYVPPDNNTDPDTRDARRLKTLIRQELQPWNRAMVEDPVQERLKEMIAAEEKKGKGRKKGKTRGPEGEPPEDRPRDRPEDQARGEPRAQSGTKARAKAGTKVNAKANVKASATVSTKARTGGKNRPATQAGGPAVVPITTALRARLKAARKERGD